MKYVKKQILHERKIQDRQLVINADGSIELNPINGEVKVNGNLSVTGTQEDFDMVFSTMIGGSIVEKFRLGESVSTLTTDLAINNDTLSTNQTTFNLLNTNATTINFAGAATEINLGAATGTFTVNNEISIFNSTRAIQLPIGSDAERPTGSAGFVRFNTDLQQFEGFNGLAWNTLGGVRDVAGDTFILAETSPGANEDTLFFHTGGELRMTLNTADLDIDDTINVKINSTESSIDETSGALVVDGGVGIAENLYVGGRIGGDIQIGEDNTNILTLRSGTVLSPDTLKLITDATSADVGNIIYPITLAHHNISGTPVPGIGTGIKFEIETQNDNFETGGQIDVVAQDVTGTQEDFDMVFSTMIGGSIVEKFRLGESVSTLTTDLAINNDTLSTNQTTFNLLNTNATTINFAGAATEINLGATGGLTTIDQSVIVEEDLTVNGELILTNTDLAVQYGGTGVSTFTTNGVLYGAGTDPLAVTAAAGTSDVSTSNQILTVDQNNTPVWTDTIDSGLWDLDETPPSSNNNLSNQSYLLNTGNQIIDASVDFSGPDIVYTISPTISGINIDSSTGLITVSTDNEIILTTITVTGTNFLGSATSSFTLEVVIPLGLFSWDSNTESPGPAT